MACPRCGEICHCHPDVCAAGGSRPRFEINVEDASQASSARLIDPESYDSSEEQFSASLEMPAPSRGRFVPEPLPDAAPPDPAPANRRLDVESTLQVSCDHLVHEGSAPAPAIDCEDPKLEAVVDNPESSPNQSVGKNVRPPSEGIDGYAAASPDAWKEEVAAHLNRYRAKRKPRPPKYPSLHLNFEPAYSPPPSSGGTARGTAVAVHDIADSPPEPSPPPLPPQPYVTQQIGRTSAAPNARVIEFPRFFAPPEISADQLAEPISDQPRILDAPEVELPAPALGGIFLEATEQQALEERPGFEVPLRSAPVSRRLFAAAVDLAIIGAAAAMFGYIFLKLTSILPPISHLLASAGMIAIILWAGYQYLLLTYSGATPGLRLAKLRLTHFDGSLVKRSTRRWRVLASILSAVSLGLGFAWCFLDEDALCWHDRITRTHLAPLD